MGDRVLISFKDDTYCGLSPAVYLHWLGGEAVGLVREAAPQLRRDDALYSAARFCGFVCAKYPGRTGIGIYDAPPHHSPADASQGDAGVVVVDMSTGDVAAFGGYLAREAHAPIEIERVPR